MVTGTTAYGALINIPDVTSLPYFNLIPSNGFYISRQSQADSLNAFWAGSIPAKIFKLGYNQYVVQDHMNIVRQSTPGELILMTAPFNHSSCASMDSMGTYTPIPNQYVLTTEELQDIHNAVTSFNLFIYQESLKYRLAYVDMNQYLKTLMSGVVYNGISYNANYITGGAFSLDGIHLTQRGYALAANNIIATVDSYYHATVPLTDANKYNGILYT